MIQNHLVLRPSKKIIHAKFVHDFIYFRRNKSYFLYFINLLGECSNGEWECDDGECIQESSLQDGRCDCNDGSDESEGFCESEGCSSEEYECDDGKCITVSDFYDGVCDCNDGSDELEGFCGSEGCSSGKWECDDGGCIPGDFVLDGYCDCYDCSDEDW